MKAPITAKAFENRNAKNKFVCCSHKGLGENPRIQSPAHSTWAGFEKTDPSETIAETQGISI